MILVLPRVSVHSGYSFGSLCLVGFTGKFWLPDFCRLQAGTAVQLVFYPFSQLVPQLELYSQLQLSLRSDPIPFSVPKST